MDEAQNARLAPYIGFTALFAGIGALSLSLLFTFIGYQLPASEAVAFAGFLFGYVVGGVGGAAFGFKRAVRRRARIESGAHEWRVSTNGVEQIVGRERREHVSQLDSSGDA